MADKTEGEVLRFAGVTLDLGRGSLRNAAGAEVPLAPKPFDLLRTLAREAGRTVSKDALLDAVWPGVTVTEDSLFQAVRDARRAIGDEEGRVLRSVPRRGSLLDAAVDAAPAAPPVAEPLTHDARLETFEINDNIRILGHAASTTWATRKSRERSKREQP
ncbi:MAG: winged helix-turn-helix domain-containing protein, partial [Sphingopyxis sp.]|nr:winged helix-turn-helix domain-containing protein [Sphingopyxis sp.]